MYPRCVFPILAAILVTQLVVCIAQNNTPSNEYCYSSLGCLSNDRPWRSSIRPIPNTWPPDRINTTFLFFTRPETNRSWEVTAFPSIALNGAQYDDSKPTYFITHGFSSNGRKDWVMGIKSAILEYSNANVFAVDWGMGANKVNYLQAVANTQVVGRELGILAASLIKTPPNSWRSKRGKLFRKKKNDDANHPQIMKLKSRAGRMHLIGHSLGAQVSGYAAKYIRDTLHVKVDSITALDAAQTMFEFLDRQVRLTKRDAVRVVAIHTSARPLIPSMGMGHMTPLGHVDFYINGGSHQPGCKLPNAEQVLKIKTPIDLAKYDVGQLSQQVSCDHSRAHKYFLEAISNPDCIFWGHKASAQNIHEAIQNIKHSGALSPIYAMSKRCTHRNCVAISLDMHRTHHRGSFIVHTTGTPPFCVPEDGIQGIIERHHNRTQAIYLAHINKPEGNPNELIKSMNDEHKKQMEVILKLTNPKLGIKMEIERLKSSLKETEK